MSLKNIIITASIGSITTQSYGQRTYIASTDEQSFPIEEITGSYAGAWPSFIPRGLNSTDSASNTTINLIVNVTQSWDGSNPTIYGYVPYAHNTMEEFINGEFSGSEYVVTDGNLTDEDCEQFLEYDPDGLRYKIVPYSQQYNDIPPPTLIFSYLSAFLNEYTVPNPGQILMFYTDVFSGPGFTTRSTNINYLKIHRFDENGNNNTISLQGLEKIIWIDSSVGLIELDVINKKEYVSYYFFEVTSPTYTNILYFADDNTLDYTFLATASIPTPIPLNTSYDGVYSYLTSSWEVIYDTNNGFDTSSGQYTFSSTPNIDLSFSASMSITVLNPASVSLAINAYDPAYTHTISNVVGSYPAPLISSVNTFILPSGSTTHSIFISGTVPPHPVQNYKYEVDLYIKDIYDSSSNVQPYGTASTINTFSNFELFSVYQQRNAFPGRGPIPPTATVVGQFLPYSYPDSASIAGTSPNWRQLVNQWVSTLYPTSSYSASTPVYPSDQYIYNSYADEVPFGWVSFNFYENTGNNYGLVYANWNNYNGTGSNGVIDPEYDASSFKNYLSSGSILMCSRYAGGYGGPILFTSSYQMGLSITIPQSFSGSQQDYNLIYGPPLDTVEVYHNTTDDPINPAGLLGTIPSGAFGTFIFGPFTGSWNGTLGDADTIVIKAPSSSRDAFYNWFDNTSPSYFYYTGSAFMISSMSLFLWPQTASIHNLSFEISQSFFPTQSATSSLIFEPYIYNNFYYSDCDVLINNFSQNDVSNLVQRVSYDEGSTIPSNLQLIISGTAEPAELNDYIYTANANRLPRYEGVRTTSPGLNQPTTEGGYGNTPNVELTQTYFAYFEKIRSTFPVLAGKSAAFIKYLVDADGKTFVPSISSSYYPNLIDNYIAETNAEISFLEESGTNTTNIISVPVFRSGMYPEPILTSYKKPNSNAKTLIFKNNEFNHPSYTLTAVTPPLAINSGDEAVLKFNYPWIYPNDPVLVDFNAVENCWRFSATSDSSIIKITVNTGGDTGIFVLEKSLDLLSWESVDQYQVPSGSAMTADFFAPANDPNLFFRIKVVNTSLTGGVINGYGSLYIDTFNRTYPTDTGISIDSLYYRSAGPGGNQSRPNNTSNFNIFFDQFGSLNSSSYFPFWRTGSNSKNILTSSFFYRVYDEENPFQQRNYIGSSYNITKPFILKPFDLVSFGGSTNESYTIKRVIKNNITDQGLINTNFSTWYTSSNTGWSYNTNEGALYSSGSFPAYATQSFTTNPAASSFLLVSFKVKDWTPKINNDGSPLIAIGIDVVGPTSSQTYPPTLWYPAWAGYGIGSFTPICRNNEHYLLVQVPSSSPVSPSGKYFMSIGTMNYNSLNAPFFDGGIYDLKVQLYNEASCSLFIELDKNVSPGANLNSFLISRLVENPNYILLDDNLNTDDGFILPQDISPSLKQNYDDLATGLQKEGLI